MQDAGCRMQDAGETYLKGEAVVRYSFRLRLLATNIKDQSKGFKSID